MNARIYQHHTLRILNQSSIMEGKEIKQQQKEKAIKILFQSVKLFKKIKTLFRTVLK